MRKLLLSISAVSSLLIALCLTANAEDYVKVLCKNGDGIHNLLLRYQLPTIPAYEKKFLELNKGKFTKDKGLILGESYNVPVRIIKLNGRPYSSVLSGMGADKLSKIEDYNKNLFSRGIKPDRLRARNEVWVPALDMKSSDLAINTAERKKKNSSVRGKAKSDKSDKKDDAPDKADKADKQDTRDRDDSPAATEKSHKKGKLTPTSGLFNEKVVRTDNSLSGCVYYLDPGHGGPDPGAVGNKNGYELCEDEYAYDITLRLAKKLMEHGAKVYMTIHDPKDGIRDMQYLNNSYDEKYPDGTEITNVSAERLGKRASIINNLYARHKKTARLQRTVVIHVDSRITDKRIDIFFYYKPECEEGREFTNTLLNAIKKKYNSVQPGRGYFGTVTERNLYMLRKSLPVAAYIELGNIQNPKDQIRLIEKDNRQAIANWLCLGLIDDASQNAAPRGKKSDSD